MELKTIQHGTPEYDEMVQLRLEVLRIPLGLTFTREQLEKEKDDILLGGYIDNKLVGCCVLTPHDKDTIQLRQMAVRKDIQASGIGRQVLEYAEKVSLQKGYALLIMHARNEALGFYQKSGYEIKGEEFTEVTIPHHHMEKRLSPQPPERESGKV